MEQFIHQIDGLVRADWLNTAISVVVILGITAIVARLLTRFLRRVLHFNEQKDLPSSSIFVNIARAAVWVTGICIMLSTSFNVNVSAAITALGIGGIAISLGFQDTLSNLIGGLQLSLLRIIKPGDNIEVGSSSGVVKDITWRHTTIRNSKGEEVVIPNSIINKTALTHLPPTNQVSLPIVVVTPGEHLNDVAAAIEHEASEAAGSVAKLTKEPKLSFSAITDGGYVGSITFKVADSRTSARAGDAVLRAVAPLTRAGAPEAAGKVLEEARQEAEEASEEAAEKPKSKPAVKASSRQASPTSLRKRMARMFRTSKGGRS